MQKSEELPITVALINRLANLRITYEHVNFQFSLSIRKMGSHCCAKRPTSKHHNLQDPKSVKKYINLLQKRMLYNSSSTKHCIKLHLERKEAWKLKKQKKTLLVRSRTSVLALERQERDQRSSFSHANRTARRRSLARSGVGSTSGSWKSG